MKRYRRLVALVAVSVLVHLLVLCIVGGRWYSPVQTAAAPAPIAVRLQPLPDRTAPRPAPPTTPATEPLPASTTAALAAPAAAAPPDAAARPPSPEAPAQAPDQAVPLAAAADADEPFQAPPRYRVRTPPSATMDYAFTEPDGQQSAAQIAWQTDGSAFTLAATGVMGQVTGTGAIGDNGIEPKQSRVRRGDGAEVAITFAAGEIAIDGRPYRNSIGSQDPASLLLQLVGMGVATPAQMRDVVSVYVATADGPLVMQFQVTEEEDLATPLGHFNTHHLLQLVQPGQARLEIWLAPQRRWLPLQLRLTAPGGAVSTQTITRIAE